MHGLNAAANIFAPNPTCFRSAQGPELQSLALVLALFVFLGILVIFFIFANYFGLWIQSKLTGAGIGFLNLVGMTFRRVNSRSIVRSRIMAAQAGLVDPDLNAGALEAHYLAGGNVQQVIRALIARPQSQDDLADVSRSHGDRLGRSGRLGIGSNQRVPQGDRLARPAGPPSRRSMPSPGTASSSKSKPESPFRANLQQLIGGATEETIIARVGEGHRLGDRVGRQPQSGARKPRHDFQSRAG